MLGKERKHARPQWEGCHLPAKNRSFSCFIVLEQKKKKKSSLENYWHLISNFQPPDCEKNEFALFCFVILPIPEGCAGEEAENYYGAKTLWSTVLDRRLGWVKMDNFLSHCEQKISNKGAASREVSCPWLHRPGLCGWGGSQYVGVCAFEWGISQDTQQLWLLHACTHTKGGGHVHTQLHKSRRGWFGRRMYRNGREIREVKRGEFVHNTLHTLRWGGHLGCEHRGGKDVGTPNNTSSSR